MVSAHVYSEMAAPAGIHSQEYEQEADYKAYFFGSLRILRGDQPVGETGQRREKASLVLRWLLLNPGRPFAAEEMLDQFWAGQDPGKAMVKFHVTMHFLRRMLEPELSPRQESTFIRRSCGNFYRFDPAGRWWTDAAEVERLLDEAHACDARGDLHRASFYYRQVAGYCSMGFLVGEPELGGFGGYRRRISQIHSVVLLRLLDLATDTTTQEELLDYAYQLVRIDQCNEAANRLIIGAYLDSGNTARAAWRLERYCESLIRELGIRPSSDLLRLRDRIQPTGHTCPGSPVRASRPTSASRN